MVMAEQGIIQEKQQQQQQQQKPVRISCVSKVDALWFCYCEFFLPCLQSSLLGDQIVSRIFFIVKTGEIAFGARSSLDCKVGDGPLNSCFIFRFVLFCFCSVIACCKLKISSRKVLVL